MNPLSQLEDIQLPQSVSIWPLAPAYWIIIGLGLCVLCLCGWLIYKRLKSRDYRRFIRELIMYISRLDDDDPHFLLNVQKALKLAADKKRIKQQPVAKSETATLAQVGDQWKDVLAQSRFVKKDPKALDVLFNVHKGVYDPSVVKIDNTTIKEYAVSWVKAEWMIQGKPK
ncbi:MAG: DUF4381 domain-containing protein [Pseudomonadota bacterium]